MNAIRAANDIPLASVVLEELKKSSFPTKRLDEAQFFISAFFARIASTDVDLHTPAEWAAVVAGLFDFMQQRQSGRTSVRVTDAGHAARSAVEIVTDDMPFLVDTVTMVLSDYSAIHAVLHPVVKIARDPNGQLQSIGDDQGKPESVMHFEVDNIQDEATRTQVTSRIADALEDVRAAVRDWSTMRDKALAIAADLPNRKLQLDASSINEASEFLRWLADNNFTFLGYREYEVAKTDGDEVLRPVEESGLGILHKSERSVAPRSLRTLAAHDLPQSGSYDAIILTKTNARSHVHRPSNMDYVGVLKFDANGTPVSEQRFLGLFTSNAYMTRPQEVPLVRQRVEAVMARSGLKRDAYSGKALRHILETLPQEELFQSAEEELFATATGILELQQRARTRMFVRRDRYGRFFTCLVFVPRERFNTTVRERIEAMLREVFHGESLDSNVLMGESALARLHVTVRPRPGDHPKFNVQELEARLLHIVRNWHDGLRDSLIAQVGAAQGVALFNRFGKQLPAGYVEDVSPEVAANDVVALTALKNNDSIHLNLYEDPRDQSLRFKVIHVGAPISLSDALPMLENMGVRMLAEHVYTLESEGRTLTIHDFELKTKSQLAFDLAHLRDRFERGFEALWRGQAESDGFNNLVLLAQADWRQVAMLRGYCKYLQQVGIAFSQSYMEETLNRYPAIAGLLIELFNAKFDTRRELLSATELENAQADLRREMLALIPAETQKAKPELIDNIVGALSQKREQQVHLLWEALKSLLDDVASLDDERILLSFMNTIKATLRTSFFQTWDGAHRHYISFKFDSKLVPDAPKPVPYREIFVYSPRVEGIHLRFGPVARGGLRWSDRREDFRTEVLGLVKAQMVKNTVIVPVGSKGGFFVKHPPVGGDRDAQLAEGIACYRLFINGLLDITDNLIEGKVVPPHDVVRHDQDDPYLVVAADKGTATFSDIANAISIEHGFWLGDAFASGGSNGYDHKGMGITAKGAWESVKRHFRALGRDSQSEDFTCAGIGDMSGDVFGNGMLLSEHIRLIAAFDHRHIFLDPNPDTAKSFVERERMFKLPRSSWDDYDKSLISAGGGIWPRSVKSIPISPEVRAVLGLKADVQHLAPSDLMSAILKAPVDLLWNGGIGTYVKASSETHGDVGDRANNALRINGTDLRCKVVGEGGNLGFTQKGRIEAAQHGVLLNTDFIDNSAGVDTSDHEVDIKILLDDAVQRNEISVD
ncbi:MAG TPA: NAD-glutamate dehydrogenase domain-containing protein, partial [Dyella sp.]|nr:NAD-glutamate dehydrogenase domain-containing protein [Dyella sp.]